MQFAPAGLSVRWASKTLRRKKRGVSQTPEKGSGLDGLGLTGKVRGACVQNGSCSLWWLESISRAKSSEGLIGYA